MLKHEIRKLFLEKRKALSVAQTQEYTLQLKKQFEAFLPSDVKTVHTYLPIASKAEIDTWPIIHGLWAHKINVAVPVMVLQNSTMISKRLTPQTKIALNSWKIPEPIDSDVVNQSDIDAVIIPLLACDLSGFRVGYGKGLYDGFLATLDKNVMKMGLSFFHPIDSISNPDSWDIPLNYCICPDEIFKF